jgi:hypothetical protein
MCAELCKEFPVLADPEVMLRLNRRWIINVLRRPRDKEQNLIVRPKEGPPRLDPFYAYWRKMGMSDWQIAILRRQFPLAVQPQTRR